MNALSPFNTTNTTLTNNLSRLNTVYPPTGTGNTASGNISNANPNFTTYTVNTNYSTSYNFTLMAGSPAIGTGLGASDIGPHGSTTNFSEKGEVLIVPIIRSLSVSNPNIAPNGTLNIQINAAKPTDN